MSATIAKTAKTSRAEMIGPRPHRFTVGEFYLLDAAGIFRDGPRVELLDGEIIEMLPPGSEHAGQINNVNRILVIKCGADYTITPQNPIRLSDISEPLPDFAVLKFRADFYTKSHPKPADVLLIIEVSDSSLKFDLERKAIAYATARIPDYWVLDVQARCVHVFSKPRAGKYTAHRTASCDDALTAIGVRGFSVRVSELFV